MRRFRDPLFLFLLIGAGLFVLDAVLERDEVEKAPDAYRIEITDEILAVLEDEWRVRWHRPPTPEELEGLVDAYVKEEILFREAIKLGLDRSDSVIRRRLAQKMEFLTSDIADTEEVADEKLDAYYQEKAENYIREPEFGFQHLFFSTEKHADAEARAGAVLEALRDGSMSFEQGMEQADPARLSSQFATTARSIIGRQFGGSFSAALAEAEVDAWFGPVPSAEGLHLVRVLERIDGGLPPLEEVREQVLDDYRYDQRAKLNKEMLDQLLEKYEVVIADLPKDSE